MSGTSERTPRNWNTTEAVRSLQQRSLANMSPLLATYLSPGQTVLDVGCGPGTITLDIAALVRPGHVTGVDQAPNAIEQAQVLARENGVETVSFQVGDAYALDFPDATFDLTCSLNLLAHLRQPVKALIEQKRVTQSGGWVVASNGDFGGKIFYPPCPALESIFAGATHLRAADSEAYTNWFLGRESRAIFANSGFTDVEVRAESVPFSLCFPGTESFDRVWDTLKTFLDGESRFGPIIRELRRVGVVDDETLRAAREEMAAFRAHPHALYLDEVRFVAAGRVP